MNEDKHSVKRWSNEMKSVIREKYMEPCAYVYIPQRSQIIYTYGLCRAKNKVNPKLVV